MSADGGNERAADEVPGAESVTVRPKGEETAPVTRTSHRQTVKTV